MIKYLLLILLSVIGCNDILINSTEDVGDDKSPLYLYMKDTIQDNRELDENGYWKVKYMGYNYTDVLYQTNPYTRVYWDTPDSFYVSYQNRIFSTPIINNSTFSRKDGSGKQMIYIDEGFIGDTLMVIGCLDDGDCKSLSFVVY
jgi:hypothetical protein